MISFDTESLAVLMIGGLLISDTDALAVQQAHDARAAAASRRRTVPLSHAAVRAGLQCRTCEFAGVPTVRRRPCAGKRFEIESSSADQCGSHLDPTCRARMRCFHGLVRHREES